MRIGAKMELGREAAARAAECLVACRSTYPFCMSMGADDGAIEHVHLPTSVRCHRAEARSPGGMSA
jgi:hypothetical protein